VGGLGGVVGKHCAVVGGVGVGGVGGVSCAEKH